MNFEKSGDRKYLFSGIKNIANQKLTSFNKDYSHRTISIDNSFHFQFHSQKLISSMSQQSEIIDWIRWKFY
jgi:hypothetical protein